jgi:2-keto-myo-inositol isomerase
MANEKKMMTPCINQATVMKADTVRFIESAGRNGFSQVELDIDRLEAGIKKDEAATIRAALLDAGVKVVSLNAIDNYPIITESEMSSSIKRSEQVLELCRTVDCKLLVVNPANFKSVSEEEFVERRFDQFIDRVFELGFKKEIRIGYEYVSYSDKVINTLEKSVQALKRWKNGIDLVLDVFHMYRTHETIENLPRDLTSRLLAFHVNDAPDIPIERVVDTDRVMPLDGVIGVDSYIRDLKNRGYSGPASVELFNHKYWEMNLDDVVKQAKQSVERLLES